MITSEEWEILIEAEKKRFSQGYFVRTLESNGNAFVGEMLTTKLDGTEQKTHFVLIEQNLLNDGLAAPVFFLRTDNYNSSALKGIVIGGVRSDEKIRCVRVLRWTKSKKSVLVVRV